MIYILVLTTLFTLQGIYFLIAERFNIVDKPNDRSSHTLVTLRGGGVVFYFGALLYFIVSGYEYPWFFIGLTLMAGVSFLDDIFTLSNKVRLFIHFASVLLMALQLNIFSMPLVYLILAFVIVVGVINAYNFMDGINGITACYSLAVGGLLLLVNQEMNFIDGELLVYTILALFVFTFFNFRSKAKCFAGDVGSVSIAYILLYILGALILKTGNFIYFLFLVVYGVDSIWTIIRRLVLRENIFKAHRSHLYQFLANEAGVNKLLVSSGYGIVQFVIGLLVIYCAKETSIVQIWFSLILLVTLSVVYLILKSYVLRKYVKFNQSK